MISALLSWLRAQLGWTYWIGNYDNEPVMLVYDLIHSFGFQVAIHKIVKKDKLGCFHSHPARAWRFVLWGGYIEEIWLSPLHTFDRWCGPGFFGRIDPEFIHRVEWLPDGPSWSLWIRGRVVAKIQLVGNGWPATLKREAKSGEHELHRS